MNTDEPQNVAAHTGKIGRLPFVIRERLNRRLRDGQEAKPVLRWLNRLPETKKLLARKSQSPINEQNLSEWRQGGYQEWLAKEESLAQTRQILEEARETAQVGGASMLDEMAVLLSARCAMLLVRTRREGLDTETELRLVHRLVQDIGSLRRGNQRADGMKIEQDRLALQVLQPGSKLIKLFLRWYADPEVRQSLRNPNVSDEERIDNLRRAVFGVAAVDESPSEGTDDPPATAPGSEPNQPKPKRASPKRRTRRPSRPRKSRTPVALRQPPVKRQRRPPEQAAENKGAGSAKNDPPAPGPLDVHALACPASAHSPKDLPAKQPGGPPAGAQQKAAAEEKVVPAPLSPEDELLQRQNWEMQQETNRIRAEIAKLKDELKARKPGLGPPV